MVPPGIYITMCCKHVILWGKLSVGIVVQATTLTSSEMGRKGLGRQEWWSV